MALLHYRIDLDNPAAYQAAFARDKALPRLVGLFLREAEATAEGLAGPMSGAALGLLTAAASSLNTVFGQHFGAEIKALAKLAGVSAGEILLANIAYDLYACDPTGSTQALGCSTYVRDSSAGPLHARNLDWGFQGRALRKYSCVTQFYNGPKGAFTTVGWPGFVGALTGIAPGRFSITVNYVRHTEDSGVLGLAKRALLGHWPVSFVVRDVLQNAANYRAAVRMLKQKLLLAPVIFTVAGTKPGEGMILERGATTWAERPISADEFVCTTNHYVSDELEENNLGDEEIDTHDRYDFMAPLLEDGAGGDPKAALRLLSRVSLLSDITQHQVVMRPRDGYLAVRVPGKPVEVIKND